MDNRIYRLITSFTSTILLMLSVLLVSCNIDDYNDSPITETETNNTNNESSYNNYNPSGDDGADNNSSIEGQNLLINGGMETWHYIVKR